MKNIIKRITTVMLMCIMMLNVVLPCLYNNTFASSSSDLAQMIKSSLENQLKSADADGLTITENSELKITIPDDLNPNKRGVVRRARLSTASDVQTPSGSLIMDEDVCKPVLKIKISESITYTAEPKIIKDHTDNHDGVYIEWNIGTIQVDGVTYKCYITEYDAKTGEFEYEYDSSDGKLIVGKFTYNNITIDAETQGSLQQFGGTGMQDEERTEALSMENYIAMAVNALANGLNKIVASIFNETITMDKLIFNHYSETQISFFEGKGSGSSIIWGQNGDGGLSKTVNDWYSIFRKFAIVVYMVLLVYMGVRIVLSSTGKNMAMYKNLFMYWCIGVAILFLYPYAMKYTIELNNTFVQMVENSKFAILGSNSSGLDTTVEGEKVDDLLTIDFDANPFGTPANGSTDYMAVIANEANSSLRIAIALTYLVLTWQLLTMIVYYYKRVFTIALLIVIFPLVVASFVIDRVADGKSQAFSKWNKEFMLNVLIQSFHAIVYVFVCGTVEVTLGSGSDATMDYILILTGITFMFTGEEIIKKIFTQGESSTTKSLAQTSTEAAGVVAATSIASKVGKAAVRPLIGQNSIWSKGRALKAETRAARLAYENFDRNAAPNENPHSGIGLSGLEKELKNIDNDKTLTPTQKNERRAEAKRTAQAVDTFNNPNNVSVDELGESYQIIMNELQKNPKNPILNNLNLTNGQINAMAGIAASAAAMILGGKDDNKTIEQDITVKLALILDGMDEATVKKYTNAFMQNLATHGASAGYTEKGTQEESDEMYKDISGIYNGFNFRYTDIDSLPDEKAQKAENDRDKYVDEALDDVEKILVQHKREYFAVKTEYNRRDMEENATDEEKQERKDLIEGFEKELQEFEDNKDVLAESLAIFLARNDGVYSAEEQLEALNNLKALVDNNTFASEAIEKTGGIDKHDIEVYTHTLASKIAKDDAVSKEAKDMAQTILEEYEGEDADLRDGFDDTEFSIHEAIKNFGNKEEYDKMTQRVKVERMEANQKVWEETMKIGEDYIRDNNVDVNKGRFDGETLYVGGKTKEQVEGEYEKARKRSGGWANFPRRWSTEFKDYVRDGVKDRYNKYMRDDDAK